MDKKLLTIHLQIAPRTQLVQQVPFSENCLPMTIKLANKNKARIIPQLDKETAMFSFEEDDLRKERFHKRLEAVYKGF